VNDLADGRAQQRSVVASMPLVPLVAVRGKALARPLFY